MTDTLALVAAAPLSEDTRWADWKAKGRAEDWRFRRTLRMVFLDLAAIVALGGAVWFAFQF